MPLVVTHGSFFWLSALAIFSITGIIAAGLWTRARRNRARREAWRALGSPTPARPGVVTLDGKLGAKATFLAPESNTAVVEIALPIGDRHDVAVELADRAVLIHDGQEIPLRGDAKLVLGTGERNHLGAMSLSLRQGERVRVFGTLVSAANADDGALYREPTARLELRGDAELPIRIAAKQTDLQTTNHQRVIAVAGAIGVFAALFVVMPHFIAERSKRASSFSEASALVLCATPFHREAGLRALDREWSAVTSYPELQRLLKFRSLKDHCDSRVGATHLEHGALRDAKDWATQCDSSEVAARAHFADAEWSQASDSTLLLDFQNDERERRSLVVAHLLRDDRTRALEWLRNDDTEDDELANCRLAVIGTPGRDDAPTRCRMAQIDAVGRVSREVLLRPTSPDVRMSPGVRAVRALLMRELDSTVGEEVVLPVPRLDTPECPLPRGALALESSVLDALLENEVPERDRPLVAVLAARRSVVEHVARRDEDASRWMEVATRHANTAQVQALIEHLQEPPTVHIADTSLERALQRGDEPSARALLQLQGVPFRAATFLSSEGVAPARIVETIRYGAHRPSLGPLRTHMCDLSARVAVAQASGHRYQAAHLNERLQRFRAALLTRKHNVLIWALEPHLEPILGH